MDIVTHVTGMPCPDGKSILLCFNNTSACANYIFKSTSIRNVVQISFWKVTINRTGFYLEGNRFKKFSVKSYACEKSTTVNTSESVNTSKIGEDHSGVALSHVHSSQEMSDQTDSEMSRKPSQKITNVTYYKECVSSEISDNTVYSDTCHVYSKNFNNLEELHLHQLACQNTNTNETVLLHCKFCSKVYRPPEQSFIT